VKEDRLTEANAWKVYVDEGVASVSEMRQALLGLPEDNERPVPRFIMTAHAGPVPIANLMAIAGPVNPDTMMPAETIPMADTGDAPPDAVAGTLPGKTLNTPGALVSTFNPDEPEFPQNENAVPPPPTTIAVAKAGITTETGLKGVDLQGRKPDEDDDEEEEEAVSKELSRWRANARGRVKIGKSPRAFVSGVIPNVLHLAVSKALEGATTRAEVDAVFVEAAKRENPFSVRKALSLLDQISAHYAPLIADALAESLPSEAKLTPELTSADLDTTQLESVLTDAIRDAWIGGALIAADAVAKPVKKAGPLTLTLTARTLLPTAMQTIDWGGWTPGWAGAAATISDPGLSMVLSAVGATIQGIADSTVDQIGSQIAQGIAGGQSVPDIAMGLRDFVGGDASRAFMISQTEVARAQQSASMDTYQANGIEMLDWLAGGSNTCSDCHDNADGSPYAAADFPALPAHPRCVCASSPNVESLMPTSSNEPEDTGDEE
jgi:SPP1 gp7 family putative phage head morphogenesis protein